MLPFPALEGLERQLLKLGPRRRDRQNIGLSHAFLGARREHYVAGQNPLRVFHGGRIVNHHPHSRRQKASRDREPCDSSITSVSGLYESPSTPTVPPFGRRDRIISVRRGDLPPVQAVGGLRQQRRSASVARQGGECDVIARKTRTAVTQSALQILRADPRIAADATPSPRPRPPREASRRPAPACWRKRSSSSRTCSPKAWSVRRSR